MKVLVADPTNQKAISYIKDNSVEVSYQPQISPSQLTSQISNYDALMVRSRTKVTKDIIEKGKNLKVVARIGSGYDNIDVQSCREKNITVVNAPDANSAAVAEVEVGLIISYLRNLPKTITSMKEGLWLKNESWGEEINGKTVGILGYGHVGKKVANIMQAFGANVLIHSRNFQTASLREIFSRSDIVTIHLSLNDETRGCITQSLLSEMKQTALFVNLARAQLVDEGFLYKTLKQKKIKGAVLDVFWQEPLPADSRWRELDNVILTPHIGAATYEAHKKASLTVAMDVVRVLKEEKPVNSIT